MIKGYRDLTDEEKQMINHIKQIADQVGSLVVDIQNLPGSDPRWAAEGKTDLQKGFMSLVRSIARPTSF